MLPRPYRLTKERDFSRLKRDGRSVYAGLFRISRRPNQLAHSRFAVVVPVKVAKKATDRNRLKRQCLEIIRLKRAKIKDGYDIVIWPASRAVGQPYAALVAALGPALDKANLL